MASDKQNPKVKSEKAKGLRVAFSEYASRYGTWQALELLATLLDGEAENSAALDRINEASKYMCAANRIRIAAHDVVDV